MKYPKLISVSTDKNFFLFLKYDNGENKKYDFSPNFAHPFYKPLENQQLFSQVSVIDGELEWKTGQDFCPFILYENSISY